jgi:HprK-related kinase B
MLFLQCQQQPIAAGDCLANDNQVINFINAQFMNWLQQRDWLICHGAAIEYKGLSIALAAFSGGGKSTSMLRLMDIPGCNFLTNDRLFIRKASTTAPAQAAGIPKLPRINPGTILANPMLQDILPAARQQQLRALPQPELWQLEEKYDVDVLATYGAGRINHLATLDCLLILNWQHNGQACTVAAVDLNQRRDLLAAIMKSPGPFYQQANGEFQQDLQALDEQRYIDTLQTAAVFEVSGGVDFDGLVAWCRQRLETLCPA